MFFTKGELQEMYRRIHYVIEKHPHLSGLMTDEHQRYLRNIMVFAGVRVPESFEPNYELEIGYDDIPEE